MKRVITYPVPNKYGTSYKAEVKGPGIRVVVGTYATEELAQQAGHQFIATGVKPARTRAKPVAPRRPRSAVKRRPKPQSPDAAPARACPARLDMIRRLAAAYT